MKSSRIVYFPRKDSPLHSRWDLTLDDCVRIRHLDDWRVWWNPAQWRSAKPELLVTGLWYQSSELVWGHEEL